MKTILGKSSWNRSHVFLAAVLAAIATITVAGILIWRDATPTWYGYVVGEDRRIYMVNLETGDLEWISRVLDELGDPSHVDINAIDINRDESILYIASGSEVFGRGYSPLIAVRLNGAAEIVFASRLGEQSGVVSYADNVRYISQSNLLYTDFLHGEALITIVDPLTGEIRGALDIVIRKHYEVSPDGAMIAEIVPERSRVTEEGTVIVPGGILARDLRTAEIILRANLEDNIGLHPPWGTLSKNLVYVRYNNSEQIFRLEVFEREDGEQLASHELWETFGARVYPLQTYATAIPGSDDVAMSIGNSVVVFDPITAKIKSQAYIGEIRFTEVVVTDKPLMFSDQ